MSVTRARRCSASVERMRARQNRISVEGVGAVHIPGEGMHGEERVEKTQTKRQGGCVGSRYEQQGEDGSRKVSGNCASGGGNACSEWSLLRSKRWPPRRVSPWTSLQVTEQKSQRLGAPQESFRIVDYPCPWNCDCDRSLYVFPSAPRACRDTEHSSIAHRAERVQQSPSRVTGRPGRTSATRSRAVDRAAWHYGIGLRRENTHRGIRGAIIQTLRLFIVYSWTKSPHPRGLPAGLADRGHVRHPCFLKE